MLHAQRQPSHGVVGRPLTPASRAWAALVVGIVSWEVFAPPEQLLSDEASRLVKSHPIGARVAIICIGALLTAHLADLVDDSCDPVSPNFWLWKKFKTIN